MTTTQTNIKKKWDDDDPKSPYDICPGVTDQGKIGGECRSDTGGKKKIYPICLKCKDYVKALKATDSLLDDRDDFPCKECKRPLTVALIVGKEQVVFGRRSSPNYLIYGCKHCHIVVSSRALLVVDGEGMKVL